MRLATLADVDALYPLGYAAYHEARYSAHPFDETKARQLSLRAVSDRERQAVIVAERDGQLVGYCWGMAGEAMFSRAILGTIASIYVQPAARNGFAAVKLLHAFRNWARIKGCVEIHLNVTTGIRLARTDRFLRRLGFQQTGGNYILGLVGRSPASSQ